jgi:hypothetical protein
MALQKLKELPSGASGNYWKIISAQADRLNPQLIVKIALFKDKAASDASKQSMQVHTFSGAKTKQELEGNLVELGYDMIKAQCAGAAPSAISGKLMAYNDLKNALDV